MTEIRSTNSEQTELNCFESNVRKIKFSKLHQSFSETHAMIKNQLFTLPKK